MKDSVIGTHDKTTAVSPRARTRCRRVAHRRGEAGRAALRALRGAAGALAGIALGLSAAASPALASEGPVQVVLRTVEAVFQVLRDPRLPPDEKLARLEHITAERFDCETIAKLSLERGWRSLPQSDRAAFVRALEKRLAHRYGRRLEDYRSAPIETLGTRKEPGGDVIVRTRIRNLRERRVHVDYRLRPRDGRWTVIDVVVEGVSMLALHRAQFQWILANSSPGRLLELLHESNARQEGAVERTMVAGAVRAAEGGSPHSPLSKRPTPAPPPRSPPTESP